MSSFAWVKVCKMNNVIAWVYAPQWKKKAKNEVKQGATLSPSQTTAQLASLVDFFSPLLIYFSPPPIDNAREITLSVVTMHAWKRNARFLACSRLRDSDEKSFSKKKCEKRAGAGWASYFRLSALYYLRAWHRLLDFTPYGISKSRGRVCGGGGRGDINKRQKASPRKKWRRKRCQASLIGLSGHKIHPRCCCKVLIP